MAHCGENIFQGCSRRCKQTCAPLLWNSSVLGAGAADYLLSGHIGTLLCKTCPSLLEHLLHECRNVLTPENRAHKRRKTSTEDQVYTKLCGERPGIGLPTCSRSESKSNAPFEGANP